MNDQQEMAPDTHGTSRRDFVRKSVYVAPAILSLAAAPAYAKAGSAKPGRPDEPGKPDKPDKPDKPKKPKKPPKP